MRSRLFFSRYERFTAELVSNSAKAPCGDRGSPTFSRHYLVGAQVVMLTDHYSLIWLRTFNRPEVILAMWIETLADVDYTCSYATFTTGPASEKTSMPGVSNAKYVPPVKGRLIGHMAVFARFPPEHRCNWSPSRSC